MKTIPESPTDAHVELFLKMHGDESWLLARLDEEDFRYYDNVVPYGEGMVIESTERVPRRDALEREVDEMWFEGLIDFVPDETHGWILALSEVDTGSAA